MEIILAIATILGGITALWFLLDKVSFKKMLKEIRKLKSCNDVAKAGQYLKPKGNSVIVKVVKYPGKGIKIPPSAIDVPCNGVVVAVGENVENVRLGDKISWKRFAYLEIANNDHEYNMERYLSVDEENVLAVIGPDACDLRLY